MSRGPVKCAHVAGRQHWTSIEGNQFHVPGSDYVLSSGNFHVLFQCLPLHIYLGSLTFAATRAVGESCDVLQCTINLVPTMASDGIVVRVVIVPLPL